MSLTKPATRYAKSGDVHVAYQVAGSGKLDLVVIPGLLSHVDLNWEPPAVKMTQRLASFSRIIMFDKRGTGASDPVTSAPTLEERMDDIRAVMDAASSERAALFGFSEGAPLALLFAATYPQRVDALVLYGAMARTTEATDYPWAAPADALLEAGAELITPMWGTGEMVELFSPSLAGDPQAIELYGRLERMGARARRCSVTCTSCSSTSTSATCFRRSNARP